MAVNALINKVPLYNFEPAFDIFGLVRTELPEDFVVGSSPARDIICLWLAAGYFINKCKSTIAEISPTPLIVLILLNDWYKSWSCEMIFLIS